MYPLNVLAFKLSTVLAVFAAVLAACAPAGYGVLRDETSWSELEFLVAEKHIRISAPDHPAMAYIHEPVIMRSVDMVATDVRKEPGTWFPVHLSFDRSGQFGQFVINVGADMIEGVDILARGPEQGIIDFEKEWWDSFSDSKNSQILKQLHMENFHESGTFTLPSGVWERYFAEGVLDSVFEDYRLALSEDTYFVVQFKYDRRRWKTDPEWFGKRSETARKVMESIVID
jgi:hypothetical protein